MLRKLVYSMQNHHLFDPYSVCACVCVCVCIHAYLFACACVHHSCMQASVNRALHLKNKSHLCVVTVLSNLLFSAPNLWSWGELSWLLHSASRAETTSTSCDQFACGQESSLNAGLLLSIVTWLKHAWRVAVGTDQPWRHCQVSVRVM